MESEHAGVTRSRSPRQRLTEELRLAGCVFAEDEAEIVLGSISAREIPLSDSEADMVMRDYVERRRHGEPAEYILGSAVFAGLRVAVGPGVFIPRRWTEQLLRRAVSLLDEVGSGVVVDLGTGSGALALAVHARSRGCRVWATEIDPGAAAWAELNFAGLAGVTVCTGDLYGALPPELEHEVDLVIGSLPYVPSEELEQLPHDHLLREPTVAFDGGPAGLAIVSRAIANAGQWLRPGGHILLEIGIGQGPGAEAIAAREGFGRTVIHRDADGGELFLEASGATAGRP